MLPENSLKLKKSSHYSNIFLENKTPLYEKLKGRNLNISSNNTQQNTQIIKRTPSNAESSNHKNYSSFNNILTRNTQKKINNENADTGVHNQDCQNNKSFNTPSNKSNFNLDFGRNERSHVSLVTREGAISPSLSTLQLENRQNKPKLIKNLKSNLSEENLIRKKNANQIEDKKNEQTRINLISQLKNGSNQKSHECLNEIVDEKISNTNISFEIKNDNTTIYPTANTLTITNSTFPSNLKKVIVDLENNLEELLKSTKTDNDKNKMLTNSKNYSIYKKVFEELIKLFPEYSRIFKKILNGFNEIFHSALSDCKVLREKSDNFEMVMSKYSNMNKKYIESTKIIKSKEEEIESLKARILEMERGNSQLMKSVDYPSGINVLSTHSEKKEEESEHNKAIMSINKRVMEDLDALYFYDKIEMRSKSVTPTSVPKLDLNFSSSGNAKKVEKKKENQNQSVNNHVYLTTNNAKEKEEPYKITNKNISNLNKTANHSQQNQNSSHSNNSNNSTNNIKTKKYINNNYNFNDFLQNQKISTFSTKATNSSNSIKYDLNFKHMQNNK